MTAHLPPHLGDDALQALADGLEVAGADHVQTCAACAATVAEYRALFGGLEALPMEAPPPRFTAQVMARVDAFAHRRAHQRTLAAATLACSAVLAAGFFALAGDGAWAIQISRASSSLVALVQLAQALAATLAPVLRTCRVPLLAGLTALCVPAVAALYRSLSVRIA